MNNPTILDAGTCANALSHAYKDHAPNLPQLLVPGLDRARFVGAPHWPGSRTWSDDRRWRQVNVVEPARDRGNPERFLDRLRSRHRS